MQINATMVLGSIGSYEDSIGPNPTNSTEELTVEGATILLLLQSHTVQHKGRQTCQPFGDEWELTR